MQNIHVGRYSHPDSHGFTGWVEPEDRSWIVFIPEKGEPQLWLGVEAVTEDGKTEHAYAPAGVVAIGDKVEVTD